MSYRFELARGAARTPLAVLLLVGACSGAPAPDELLDSGSTDASASDGSSESDAAIDAHVDSTVDAGTDAGSDAGTDAGPMGNDGLPIGSPCTLASECATPSWPACLTQLMPLAPAAAAGAPEDVAYLGLTFPDGYCSSLPNCDEDADCDSGGGCWRPFAEVQPDIIDSLETTLSVPPGTLDYLVDYGVCLDRCTDVDDCGIGQVCEAPLDDLTALVPGATNDRSYCVTPDPCDTCDEHADCIVRDMTRTCACSYGYYGDGTTCSPVLPVGSSCSSDAMCTGPVGIAACLEEIHPLEAYLPSGELLSQAGLDFADGYCSQDPNCTVDIQCGSGAACFAPFTQVTMSTWRDVEATFDPALAPGTLDPLGAFGYCLRRCDDSFDCTSHQNCVLPMNELVSAIPGSVSTRTFCAPEDDCELCAADAFCDTESGSGSCVCKPGFAGDGLTCEATGTSPCLPNPCRHGGTCMEVGFSFSCSCVGGYSGTICQIAP